MTISPSKARAAAPHNLVRMTVAALIAGAPLCIPAQAQESVGEIELQEVTVTGSRIIRKDFESPSPIVTVGTEQLEQTSNVSLEASLNKLPQFVPALSQLVTGDIQPTATNTPGAATLNLRGLGANRNLVLVDGRRAMPINASLAIDLNSIPSAAIERVEVITGGASSTYGADAVGGVVNFILKKNFEGIQFDAQYSQTEVGDAEEYRITGILGGNFADGRGNVMIGGEYTNRGEALLVDRDFYEKRFRDPTVAGTDFWWTAASYNPAGSGNLPDQAVVDQIFADKPANATILNTHNFFLNDDGTLYSSLGQGSIGAASAANPFDPGGAYRYKGPLDGLFRKQLANGSLGQNDLNAYVSTPLERYSLFGRGSIAFNENVSYFIQGTLSQTHVNTISQYSPAVGPWAANIPYGNDIYAPSVDSNGNTLPQYRAGGSLGLNCPAVGGCTNSQAFPVPEELARLLDSRPNPNAPWQLSEVFDWLSPRATRNNTTTYQIVTGFEGNLPFKDWTWEAYASHGQSSTTTQILGVVSLDRYRSIVTSPNYGKGFRQTQNLGDVINGIPQPGGGFAGATVTCTSGLPILSNFQVSQDCVDALTQPLQNRQRLEQTIYEVNVQGGVFEWWAGEVRMAGGISHRENVFEYQADGLTSIDNFYDSAVGIFPLGNSDGETTVSEIYAEALVPVLRDLPAVRQLNLEVGYRYSDYDPSGPVSTYKGLIDWTVTDFFRIRGGHQFASRAPNIGELFSGRTQIFGGSIPTQDICSTIADGRLREFSANPNFNPNAAQARALCEALMGPAGANQYYNISPPSTLAAGTYQATGNPNLEAEEAKTWTAGFVLRMPFENPLLEGMTLAVDYYSIDLTGAITTTTGDQIMERCFNPALNPGLDPNNIWCQAIPRNPDTGIIATTNALYSNEAAYKTSGYDIQLDWRAALSDMGFASAPGFLSVNLQASILNEFEEKVDARTPARDWKGYAGPNFTGNVAGGGGSYDYRLFTTISYNNPTWGVALRHRYLPSIKAAEELTNPGGTPVFGGNPLTADTPSYNIFDLSATWNFNSTIRLRGGIDNLFDKDPPVTGRNLTSVNGMTGGTLTTAGSGTYDPLGRRYYFGMQMNF